MITTRFHSWQAEVGCDHMAGWLQRRPHRNLTTLRLCGWLLTATSWSKPTTPVAALAPLHTSRTSKPHQSFTTIAPHTDCLTTLLFRPHYFANNGHHLPQMWRKASLWKVWKRTKTQKLLASVTLLVSLRHLPGHGASGAGLLWWPNRGEYSLWQLTVPRAVQCCTCALCCIFRD